MSYSCIYLHLPERNLSLPRSISWHEVARVEQVLARTPGKHQSLRLKIAVSQPQSFFAWSLLCPIYKTGISWGIHRNEPCNLVVQQDAHVAVRALLIRFNAVQTEDRLMYILAGHCRFPMKWMSGLCTLSESKRLVGRNMNERKVMISRRCTGLSRKMWDDNHVICADPQNLYPLLTRSSS